MNITKISLGALDKVYAVAPIRIGEERRFLFATEGQGACFQFRGSSLDNLAQSPVWEDPGGTMTIVSIPKGQGQFLAVQNFFPTFQGEKATVAWCIPQADGSWKTQTYMDLPFVHRIDVLRAGGVNYFLGATICGSKQSRDDWSDPGKVWLGILPESPDQPMELTPMLEGLVRNHGYARIQWKGKERAFVTSEQGVIILTPPDRPGGTWEQEQLLDREVSDIACCDIDGDGELELLTIEPFHGDTIAISKKIGDRYEMVWRYKDQPVNFGHIAWGGILGGQPTFLCGFRRLNSDLFYVRCTSVDPLRFEVTMIENGVGPANVSVVHEEERDLILSSNRAHGEMAIYVVTKG